jgi:hypothetical protein
MTDDLHIATAEFAVNGEPVAATVTLPTWARLTEPVVITLTVPPGTEASHADTAPTLAAREALADLPTSPAPTPDANGSAGQKSALVADLIAALPVKAEAEVGPQTAPAEPDALRIVAQVIASGAAAGQIAVEFTVPGDADGHEYQFGCSLHGPNGGTGGTGMAPGSASLSIALPRPAEPI